MRREDRACLHRWTEPVDYALLILLILLILYAWKNVKQTVTPCEVLSRHVWHVWHGKVNSLKYKNNRSGILSLFNQWDMLIQVDTWHVTYKRIRDMLIQEETWHVTYKRIGDMLIQEDRWHVTYKRIGDMLIQEDRWHVTYKRIRDMLHTRG